MRNETRLTTHQVLVLIGYRVLHENCAKLFVYEVRKSVIDVKRLIRWKLKEIASSASGADDPGFNKTCIRKEVASELISSIAEKVEGLIFLSRKGGTECYPIYTIPCYNQSCLIAEMPFWPFVLAAPNLRGSSTLELFWERSLSWYLVVLNHSEEELQLFCAPWHYGSEQPRIQS